MSRSTNASEALTTHAEPRGQDSPQVSSGGSDQSADASGSAAIPDERHQMIAVAAYYRAQHRGFAPGCEMDDWLAAEVEIEQQARAQGN